MISFDNDELLMWPAIFVLVLFFTCIICTYINVLTAIIHTKYIYVLESRECVCVFSIFDFLCGCDGNRKLFIGFW